MAESLQARALRKAASILGGPEALGKVLDASADDVRAWLDGSREAPRSAFLLAIDIIVDELREPRG